MVDLVLLDVVRDLVRLDSNELGTTRWRTIALGPKRSLWDSRGAPSKLG
jgi:hypothetical protein